MRRYSLFAPLLLAASAAAAAEAVEAQPAAPVHDAVPQVGPGRLPEAPVAARRHGGSSAEPEAGSRRGVKGRSGLMPQRPRTSARSAGVMVPCPWPRA